MYTTRTMPVIIPVAEYRLEFVRASGPGGQNVNKVSSKAQLRWRVGASRVLTDDQKARVRTVLKNRLTSDDEILVVAADERSQLQNRAQVVARFQTLINQALHLPKKRRATKPTRSSKEKRLHTKRVVSERKKARQKNNLFT